MGLRNKLLTATLLGVMSTAAQASDRSASAGFSLQAVVAPFCRIDTSAQEVGPDGVIGAVTETCNTPGYSVRAEFANLASAEVRAGDEVAPLGEDGRAIFTSAEARRRVRQWQLASAVRRDPAAPVLVRFSISPL